MSSLSFCSMSFTNSETRMHDSGFLHDETVAEEFADVLTRICISNLCGFIGIKPDFAFAATENFGGEGLLTAEIGHSDGIRVLWSVVVVVVDLLGGEW